MSRKKILIVDDSEICRDMARYLLESGGYEVVTLESPFGFSVALGRERPDLVLVDANMPAIQGDMLVRLAHQHKRADCPIVLYSDLPPAELHALARSSGADGFISKTNEADKLWREVEVFIKRGVVGGARPSTGSLPRDRIDSGPVSIRSAAISMVAALSSGASPTMPPPSSLAPPTSRPSQSGVREAITPPASRPSPTAEATDDDKGPVNSRRANRG